MSALVAQTRVELLLTLRRGENLLVTFLIPIGVLVLFANVDVVGSEVDEPIDFLVPGVLALAVMSTAMVSLGIATGFERRYGVLKRLGATPLGRPRLVAAKTGTVLLIEVVQCALILAIGVALGYDVGAGLVAALVGVLVGTVAFAGIGLGMAGTLRAEANLALTNALFLVWLLLGDIVFPLERLPDALEAIGRVLPSAALADTLRSVLTPGAQLSARSLAVLLVWAVVAPVVAARTFRWEE